MEQVQQVYSEKQIAILNSAERLFAQTGFDGTSVRDIANDAGVNVAMISYYFGSKEKLMEAVFESRNAAIKLKIENLLLDEKRSNLDKVFILIDDYVEKFIRQREFHCIMMREQLATKDTQVSEIILSLKKRNLSSIKKLIHEGQKSGEFKKNIDTVLMMATMVGTVSQVITSMRFYRQMYNLENLGEEEVYKHIRKKLSIHLKNLFKITLTNEA
jgi:AcrR family transcriptional regulator